MILTLMLIILTATLVIVIIGFVMDRLAIRKMQSGMRTLNKRIKRLEKAEEPTSECGDGYFYIDGKLVHDAVLREASDDTKADSETQEADGGDISLETNDEIQNTGD